MKMITGFVAPDAGTAVICGHDIAQAPIAAKRLHRLPAGGRARLSRHDAGRVSRFHRPHPRLFRRRGQAAHRPGRRDDPHRARSCTSRSKPCRRATGGVSVSPRHCCTIPQVLILDEPTDGLDPNQKYEMRKVIDEMRANKAIVISTHLLEEVEAVCSRAIIIAHGRDSRRRDAGSSSPAARAATTRSVSPRLAPLPSRCGPNCRGCRRWPRSSRARTARATGC